MPKLYFGSRGGVYYRKKGRKVYINRFGTENLEQQWKEFNDELCNAILNRPSFQSLEPTYVQVGSYYVTYDDYLKNLLTNLIEIECRLENITELKSNFFEKDNSIKYITEYNYDNSDKKNPKMNAIRDHINGGYMCEPNYELGEIMDNLEVKGNIIVYQGAQTKDPEANPKNVLKTKRKWNSTSINYIHAKDFHDWDTEEGKGIINVIVIPRGSHALYIDHYTDGDKGEVVLRNFQAQQAKNNKDFDTKYLFKDSIKSKGPEFYMVDPQIKKYLKMLNDGILKKNVFDAMVEDGVDPSKLFHDGDVKAVEDILVQFRFNEYEDPLIHSMEI